MTWNLFLNINATIDSICELVTGSQCFSIFYIIVDCLRLQFYYHIALYYILLYFAATTTTVAIKMHIAHYTSNYNICKVLLIKKETS